MPSAQSWKGSSKKRGRRISKQPTNLEATDKMRTEHFAEKMKIEDLLKEDKSKFEVMEMELNEKIENRKQPT